MMLRCQEQRKPLTKQNKTLKINGRTELVEEYRVSLDSLRELIRLTAHNYWFIVLVSYQR